MLAQKEDMQHAQKTGDITHTRPMKIYANERNEFLYPAQDMNRIVVMI